LWGGKNRTKKITEKDIIFRKKSQSQKTYYFVRPGGGEGPPLALPCGHHRRKGKLKYRKRESQYQHEKFQVGGCL